MLRDLSSLLMAPLEAGPVFAPAMALRRPSPPGVNIGMLSDDIIPTGGDIGLRELLGSEAIFNCTTFRVFRLAKSPGDAGGGRFASSPSIITFMAV